jgi:hypothetical protein
VAGPGLPVNVDVTYPDTGDASVKIHQTHHDLIHAIANAIDDDTLPSTPVLLAGALGNNQTGTSYTLVLADAGKVVELNNAAPVSLLVPTDASVSFPVGTTVELWQQGAGQVTVTAVTPGTTSVRAPAGKSHIAAQYGSAGLRKRAVNEWCLEGDIS